MNAKPITYHIIGGGIAGLYCAYLLKQKHPRIRAVVYEAGENIGGRCRSYWDEEFGHALDNATHVIIGANKKMRKFVKDGEWCLTHFFWNAAKETCDNKLLPSLGHILQHSGSRYRPDYWQKDIAPDFSLDKKSAQSLFFQTGFEPADYKRAGGLCR